MANAGEDTPVFLASPHGTLLGIHTRPIGEPVGAGFILCAWGGLWSGRQRLGIRLCRRLAAEGYHTLRFDYHGVGDSTGVVQRFSTEQPFVEDLDAAVRWLRTQGIDRFVLGGCCFGGRTALLAAPTVGGLEGLILVVPPPGDVVKDEDGKIPSILDLSLGRILRQSLRVRVARGLLDRDRRRAYWRYAKAKVGSMAAASSGRPKDHWVSPAFLEPLEALANSGVPILFVYGTLDHAYESFMRARNGRLGRIMELAGSRVEVVALEGHLQGFPTLEIQERCIETMSKWLSRLPKQAGGETGPVEAATVRANPSGQVGEQEIQEIEEHLRASGYIE